jgi:tRNA dimethylallyltransferase
LERKSTAELFALLTKKDARRARSIDRYNKRRLVRALEIASVLGRSPRTRRREPYDVLWIGIKPRDTVLQRAIGKRLRERMRTGMVAEARTLHARGLSYRRMKALGLEYGALARFLEGTVRKEKMLDTLERDIRRYAKRQATYWKRNRDIRWFTSPRSRAIALFVRRWLKRRHDTMRV